jgi:hypothetical protein
MFPFNALKHSIRTGRRYFQKRYLGISVCFQTINGTQLFQKKGGHFSPGPHEHSLIPLTIERYRQDPVKHHICDREFLAYVGTRWKRQTFIAAMTKLRSSVSALSRHMGTMSKNVWKDEGEINNYVQISDAHANGSPVLHVRSRYWFFNWS